MNLLTKSEIAKQLRVHENTIDRWRKKGLPFMKFESSIRFDMEAVKNWIKDNSKN